MRTNRKDEMSVLPDNDYFPFVTYHDMSSSDMDSSMLKEKGSRAKTVLHRGRPKIDPYYAVPNGRERSSHSWGYNDRNGDTP